MGNFQLWSKCFEHSTISTAMFWDKAVSKVNADPVLMELMVKSPREHVPDERRSGLCLR